jgi:hypothetical protein
MRRAGVAGALLFAQEQGRFTELQLKCGEGVLAVAHGRESSSPLHPQGFGDVGDGFREAVQSGGARVQARGEFLPPGIKCGLMVLGSRLCARCGFSRWWGGLPAAGGAVRSTIRRRCFDYIYSVSNNTVHILCINRYRIHRDNDSYHMYWQRVLPFKYGIE